MGRKAQLLEVIGALCALRAAFRAACTAVRRKPNKIPKIAVTTSSSAKVNALVVASGF